MTIDWAGFERELVAALVRTVESAVAGSPDYRFYAAVLDRTYRETDGVITLPYLGVNCEEALPHLPAERQSDIRWSPADWETGSSIPTAGSPATVPEIGSARLQQRHVVAPSGNGS